MKFIYEIGPQKITDSICFSNKKMTLNLDDLTQEQKNAVYECLESLLYKYRNYLLDELTINFFKSEFLYNLEILSKKEITPGRFYESD